MTIITKEIKRITPAISASLLKDTKTNKRFYRHRWVLVGSVYRHQHHEDFPLEQFESFKTFADYIEELPMKKGQIKV